jgi:cytochrome c biogenesis protein CcdA
MLALLVLAAAVGGALFTGPSGGQLGFALATVSTRPAEFLQQLSTILPFGYAFATGMVAAANPCGIALLPAYLGLILGIGTSDADARTRLVTAMTKVLAVSGAVTAGFIVLFGAAGLVLSTTAAVLVAYLPWASLAVGVLLIWAGGQLLASGRFGAHLPAQLGAKLGGIASRAGLLGAFTYGLVFALTSLGCTLPLFLTEVGGTLTVNGVAAGLAQFLLYGFGMGVVFTALAVAAALGSRVVLGSVKRVGRYVHLTSAFLLLTTGAYVVYYWLTAGGLLGEMRL